MEISLHISVFGGEDTQYFQQKRTFSAKSENHNAFCETYLLKNRRTFAPS